jgi:rare lipoprotein A
VRSRKTGRTLLLYPITVLLLSACAGSYAPFPMPPAPPVDDTYHPIPEVHPGCVEKVAFTEEGEASWYGRTKKMRKTASGQPLDPNAATAAHRYLPMGSRVKVTNLVNGQSMTLTINDRGPFTKGRIIDVSQRSARDLGFLIQGITRVRIETTEPAKSDC